MVRTEAMDPTARLGKGQKRTKKKESVVTAIYTIEPYLRIPEQVAEALLPETEQTTTQPPRPAPIGKEVRATLQGKDFALERLARRMATRMGEHIQQRAALTDGAEALQDRILALFPGFTLVLDIMHALEYLWDAANALLGETHPDRTAWVKKHLLSILSGETEHVILTLETQVQEPSLTDAQRKALNTTIGYYRRNLAYMHYDRYLEQGWPISSGVVEGACGHLVKDRMEQSGMRWTPAGAQAILEIRAVRVNDDWDGYQLFHRQCQHQRLYGTTANFTSVTDAVVFKKAA